MRDTILKTMAIIECILVFVLLNLIGVSMIFDIHYNKIIYILGFAGAELAMIALVIIFFTKETQLRMFMKLNIISIIHMN